MKTINPVPIWSNGSNQNATIFDLKIVNDNLENTAQFQYILYKENLRMLAEGNLTISGEEYKNWDSNPSANEFAYNWAAAQLQITITGEYIPVENTSL